MAYDTVIDKAQLEGAITASADAIREKTGDVALIPWLADKGFAEAIAAIEAGGGEMRIHGRAVVYGSFVPAQNEGKYKCYHNLNEIPSGLMLWTDDDYQADTSQVAKIAVFYMADKPKNSTRGVQVVVTESSAGDVSSTNAKAQVRVQTASGGAVSWLTSTSQLSHTAAIAASTTEITMCCGSTNSAFLAGLEYKYILFGAAQ